MHVSAAFERDWIDHVRSQLAAEGLPQAPSEDFDTIARRFFNLQWRRVPPRPRTVVRAKAFSCPPHLASGLALLEGKIQSGEVLTPHMSRSLEKLDYNDAMLNDWHIAHFHLGTVLQPHGFVDRTEPVLFAYLSESTAYFIDCRDHGAWADEDLIDIIEDEWPFLLDPFRLKGVVDVSAVPTRKELVALRKAGVMTAFKTRRGSVLVSPGGGYATDGTSLHVQRAIDNWRRFLRDVEKAARNDALMSLRPLLDALTPAPTELELRLTFAATELSVTAPALGNAVLARYPLGL